MARSTPTLLTQAEYARHRKARGLPGGTREAVDEGRTPAVDGRIDPVVADRQWEQNTRARVRNAGGDPTPMAQKKIGHVSDRELIDLPASRHHAATPFSESRAKHAHEGDGG